MKNLTLNIPFNTLMLLEAGVIFKPLFKTSSNDSNMYSEGRVYESVKKLYSPLTNARYSIRLINKMDDGGLWYAHGVQLEFSPPLVTVGNDLLMINDTRLAREVAKLLLMDFVKVSALPPTMVLHFDLMNAKLVSATTSLMVSFSDHAEATSAIEQLCDRAEILADLEWQAHQRVSDLPLPFYGNANEGFRISRKGGYHLHFYAVGDVKLNLDYKFHGKPLLKLSPGYIDASKCYIKFDLSFTREWFDGKGYYHKQIFNNVLKNIDQKSKDIVSRIFALNMKFCPSIPTARRMSEYNSFVNSLLKLYFAGENVLDMPRFTLKTIDNGEYQEVRRFVLINFDIDISVPLNLHQKSLAKNVIEELNFVDKFYLGFPRILSTFCDKSATEFLPALERLVK